MDESRRMEPKIAPVETGAAGLREMLLARGTNFFHRFIEQFPLMVAMAETQVDEESYLLWLRLQWQVHAAYEQRLRPWVDHEWAAVRLVKSSWLREDMEKLGSPLPPVVIPESAPWPVISRVGHAWGIQYVLEGSTLGSLMMHDRFVAAGLPFARARRFMEAYGDRTAAMWREFVVRLGGVPESEWNPAVEAAEDLFAAFHGLFAEAEQRRDRALRAAKVAAEQASEAKTSFLASMSHEIRTPLNALIGLASLVAEERDENDRRALVERLNSARNALLDVVGEVLDVAKIEAGAVELESEEFRLGDVLQDVHGLLAAQARAKGLDLRIVEPPADTPEVFVGDPKRLRQVLLNLVGNAVKFTAQGFVRVEIGSAPSAWADRMRLTFDVIDSGSGISAESLPRLFTPFFQAQQACALRSGGAGLGLTIVRRLVTLMGGAVSVRSRESEGTTFHVEVELAPVRPGHQHSTAQGVGPPGITQATDGASRRLEGVRVLLVDDDEANVLMARKWLERAGAVVAARGDGREAIEWLVAPGNEVDIVLMDVQMPVMDGNRAVGLLRGMDRFRTLPILALSAGACQAEREAALLAGMNGYLIKPLSPTTMIEGIFAHVRRP